MSLSQLGGTLKAISAPLVSLASLTSTKEQNGGADENQSTITFDTILSTLATIAFMALAGYLCWKCNENTDKPLRIIYTILAIIFNTFYLLWYLIVRVFMGKPCN